VHLAVVVDRGRGPAVKEQERAPRRGDLNRLKEPVHDEDGQLQWLARAISVSPGDRKKKGGSWHDDECSNCPVGVRLAG
jgi:hypothetical protein